MLCRSPVAGHRLNRVTFLFSHRFEGYYCSSFVIFISLFHPDLSVLTFLHDWLYLEFENDLSLMILHLDEPCIQVSSLHKKKVPVAFYENKFLPQPISWPYPHPVSTNRFPIHYPAVSQNDSKVQPGVYSCFYPLSQSSGEFNQRSLFLGVKKQKTLSIITMRQGFNINCVFLS